MQMQRGATWAMWLSLIGMGIAGYLLVPHLGLLRGQLLGGVACGSGSGLFNCHVVTGSQWATVFGMPLALWGVLGYIVVLALALLARQSVDWASHAATLIFVLALIFVSLDVVLLGVQAFVIRSFCTLCLASYVVNIALLIVAIRALGRPWPEALSQSSRALGALVPSAARPAAWLFWGIVLVGVAATVGLHVATTFAARGTLGNMQQQVREYVERRPRVSVDTAMDPTLGPANAPTTLVEFSDFFCPACQHASKMNKVILARHQGQTRLVFKHFPLDMACNDTLKHTVHPGACRIAEASECAHAQGRFWDFHDLVFEKGKDYRMAGLERDIEKLGLDTAAFQTCMASGIGREAVRQDIAEAKKANVTSTPTYIINGLPMTGGLTPATFDDVVAVLRERRF